MESSQVASRSIEKRKRDRSRPRFALASVAIQFRPISRKGPRVARKFIDCRDYPDGSNCTVAISADSEAEVIEAVVQHSIAVHAHEDTPEFREQVRAGIKEGAPV